MTNNEAEKKIMLRSFDGEYFVVSEAVAMKFQIIRNMIEDDCVQDFIPVPNVSAKILSMVIEYCKKHDDTEKTTTAAADACNSQKAVEEEELKKWDENFIDVDQAVLFEIILAANYLDIKELLDLACQKVADMIKGKSPEEIRRTFNIKNDFTPEEEEEIRRENLWAFE